MPMGVKKQKQKETSSEEFKADFQLTAVVSLFSIQKESLVEHQSASCEVWRSLFSLKEPSAQITWQVA